MAGRWALLLVYASAVCTSVASLVPSVAFAQAATALDRYEPAPSGDGSFAVPNAAIKGDLRVSAALTLAYARGPLELSIDDPKQGQKIDGGAIVGQQLAAHLLASLELWRRAKLDLDVPFTLAQGGDSPSLAKLGVITAPGQPTVFPSPAGTAMNDVRLGLRVALVRQNGKIPAASVGYSLWFPSGNVAAYTGTGSVRHAPSIVFGADYGRYTWSLLLGRRLQDTSNGAGLLGGEVLGGLSFAARFEQLSAHVELFGSTVTADKPAFSAPTTSAEILFGARYTFGPLTAGVMGGPGLGRGIGTPSYRLIATVGVAFDAPQKPNKQSGVAADGTGILKNGGLAGTGPAKNVSTAQVVLLDRDGDTVVDEKDLCPDVLGDPSPSAGRLGCPADRDRDLIADEADRCPDEPGVASADPSRFGCPPDTDGDGLADNVDACPKEKGDKNEDPKKSGCPASVRLEGTQIVILQSVNFATGSDVIEQDSYGLLEQVAAVFATHPEITRVAIDGHTDNAGIAKANVTLSQKRAVSVVRWLVEHGVDARRLEARGFGPRRPIADNATADGKAKNRRVEFQILKRSPKGEADWHEGAAL